MSRSRMSRIAKFSALAHLLAAVSAQTATSGGETVAVGIPTLAITSTSASITSSPSALANSSSVAPRVHTVRVGEGGFNMDPAELTDVNVGDTVTFEFYPPDHSVARAGFESACVPYEYTSEGRNKQGFFSGVKLFDDPTNPIPWNLTINSTEPIFYYCTAPGSCIDHQMVGVINPNSTWTLAKQVQAARNADFMVAPGDKIPSEASSTLSMPSTTPTSTGTADHGHDDHPHKLSGGAIAGIVVGAVAFLVICAALFFYVGRTKSLKEVLKRQDATVKTNPSTTPGTEYPGSPGYPGSPFSPNHNQAEQGFGVPPNYSHPANTHPSGWTSSPPPMHPGHAPMSPPGQPQMAEVKPAQQQQQQYNMAEMASPGHQQQFFTAELEAPIKSPRG